MNRSDFAVSAIRVIILFAVLGFGTGCDTFQGKVWIPGGPPIELGTKDVALNSRPDSWPRIGIDNADEDQLHRTAADLAPATS